MAITQAKCNQLMGFLPKAQAARLCPEIDAGIDFRQARFFHFHFSKARKTSDDRYRWSPPQG
jgi:hypothetical protein